MQEICSFYQVLQNKLLRLKTNNYTMNAATNDLLDETNDLSVHQLSAYHTVMTVFQLNQPYQDRIFPSRHINTIKVRYNLTISRSGIFYRGAKLWNQLFQELRQEKRKGVFKTKTKKWIQDHILRKPP